jgi:GH25 family lysozyme M1 (1,4-beta-N-acetylmuramidase)
MNAPNWHTRRHSLIGTLSVVCAGSLLLCTTAQASTRQSQATDHSMGSQVQAREGTHTGPAPRDPDSVTGIDVSSYQGNVDWSATAASGNRFAYVKATESTDYVNPFFAQQYDGSHAAGMLHGAYHFARPEQSSGSEQANYFVDHGGNWSPDGTTLPGALDVEYNPDGDTCYGLSPQAMTSWIRDFSDTYRARTGRFPVIYTSTRWWTQCVAGTFNTTNPLWVANYADTVGPLPRGWNFHTFWQNTSTPVDSDQFNGSEDRLQALAKG